MKKVFAFILLIMTLLSSCVKQTRIEGRIEHAQRKTVVLKELFPQEIIVVDTLLLVNDLFSYDFNTDQVGVYLLQYDDTSLLSFIINKGDVLELYADKDNFYHSILVKGNKESELHQTYRTLLLQFDDSVKELSQQLKNDEDTDKQQLLEHLDSSYYQYLTIHRASVEALIRKHPSNLASLLAFYQTLGNRQIFTIQDDRDLLQLLFDSLSVAYPNTVYVDHLQDILTRDDK